jgi:hypothetical protein
MSIGKKYLFMLMFCKSGSELEVISKYKKLLYGVINYIL